MKRKIKTRHEVFDYIMREGICTLYKTGVPGVPSLWDVVDLPDTKPNGRGFGERVSAIWGWKDQLPQEFTEEIFYGKIKGGSAVLMSTDYLKNVHYPAHHRPVDSCRELARQIFELVRLDEWATGPLRRECMDRYRCTRSRFDGALKELQITLNMVRSNEPGTKRDTWLRFEEVYLDVLELP
jgi:hypothetical protein